MKKKVLKWLGIGVAALLVITYIGVQAFQVFYNGYQTEVAIRYNMSNAVTSRALIIRDEEILPAAYNGYHNHQLEDGSKVSGGEVISEVYQSENDAAQVSTLRTLKQELAVLEEANLLVSSATPVDPAALGNQIASTITEMNNAFHGDDYSDARDYKNNLLSLISRRQSTTGQSVDLSGPIAELKSQIEALEGSVDHSPSHEIASKPGIFSSVVDGYETTLTPESLDTLTAQQVQDLLEQDDVTAAGENNLGKLVKSYDWYIVCILPAGETKWIEEGGKLTLDFLGASSESVPATVVTIEEVGENNMVVLTSDRLTKGLINLRKQNVRISQTETSGLRIPTKALQVSVDDEGNQVQGVFVRAGNTVRFRKVEILIRTSEYMLVDIINDDEYINAFDEVLVDGKDLYDGKRL